MVAEERLSSLGRGHHHCWGEAIIAEERVTEAVVAEERVTEVITEAIVAGGRSSSLGKVIIVNVAVASHYHG
jgi:hypothetical protein